MPMPALTTYCPLTVLSWVAGYLYRNDSTVDDSSLIKYKLKRSNNQYRPKYKKSPKHPKS